MKDIYDGQIYDLKTRVDIWMDMDVVPVEYETFAHTFHLKTCFFQFITGITFKWDYVIESSIALLVWIGICTKLRIYRVTTDPVRWSCSGFGLLWRASMLNWVPWTNNDFTKCHNNPVLVPPRKPLDPVKDLYDGQTYDLKSRVDIWTRMDVVPVEYGNSLIYFT